MLFMYVFTQRIYPRFVFSGLLCELYRRLGLERKRRTDDHLLRTLRKSRRSDRGVRSAYDPIFLYVLRFVEFSFAQNFSW